MNLHRIYGWLALALGLYTAVPMQASSQVRMGLHKINLRPAHAMNLCLGPATLDPNVRAELILVECSESTLFTETVLKLAGMTHLLVHEKSGLCVTSKDDSRSWGTRLVLDNCDD